MRRLVKSWQAIAVFEPEFAKWAKKTHDDLPPVVTERQYAAYREEYGLYLREQVVEFDLEEVALLDERIEHQRTEAM